MSDNQTNLEPAEGVTTADAPQEDPQDAQNPPEGEQDTFPREYVEQLRAEAAEARVKRKEASERLEGYARELFTARVAALGKLADPNDLPFNADLLEDHAALERAVDDLLQAKPHYAARTPRGDVGQGTTGASSTVDLAGLLRSAAL